MRLLIQIILLFHTNYMTVSYKLYGIPYNLRDRFNTFTFLIDTSSFVISRYFFFHQIFKGKILLSFEYTVRSILSNFVFLFETYFRAL